MKTAEKTGFNVIKDIDEWHGVKLRAIDDATFVFNFIFFVITLILDNCRVWRQNDGLSNDCQAIYNFHSRNYILDIYGYDLRAGAIIIRSSSSSSCSSFALTFVFSSFDFLFGCSGNGEPRPTHCLFLRRRRRVRHSDIGSMGWIVGKIIACDILVRLILIHEERVG